MAHGTCTDDRLRMGLGRCVGGLGVRTSHEATQQKGTRDMSNGSSFARWYMLASQELMDAIARPSAQGFASAHVWACEANDAAYGATEIFIVGNLLASISAARRQFGYERVGV